MRTILFALALLAVPAGNAAPLSIEQQASLQLWLNGHKDYRTATDDDCNCADDIKQFRTTDADGRKPQPDFHPWLAKGEFRQKGVPSFAVIVVKKGVARPAEGLILIFDGPFAAKGKAPAWVGPANGLQGSGLLMPLNGNVPLYGPYFSEGCLLKPAGKTYAPDCGEEY